MWLIQLQRCQSYGTARHLFQFFISFSHLTLSVDGYSFLFHSSGLSKQHTAEGTVSALTHFCVVLSVGTFVWMKLFV
jgi:hypothetical protein